MIKNIIFDIGNVLARFRWKDYIRELGFSPEVSERLAKATVQGPFWDELDRGSLSLNEIIDRCIASDPELEKEILAFFRDRKTLVTEYDYSAALVSLLKERGYHVYLLSNYSRDMFAYARETFRFIPQADGGIISYEIQKIKPEPEIYQALLSRYQLVPEECVFLDDLEKNLEGARAFGIRTIHFTSYRKAIRELARLFHDPEITGGKAFQKAEAKELQRLGGRGGELPFRAMIFDLDGTLWDTTEAVAEIWSGVAAKHPEIKDTITAEKLKKLYGLPLEEIARKLFVSVPESTAIAVMEECVKVQCPILEKIGAVLMGDVKETFRRLKPRCRIWIVSNCRSGYIEAFLTAHGLWESVDDFTCPGETGLLKAENIRLICDRNGITPSEALYIGDTESDGQAAHQAGAAFAFASYGFGDSKDYEYCLEDMKDLTVLHP